MELALAQERLALESSVTLISRWNVNRKSSSSPNRYSLFINSDFLPQTLAWLLRVLASVFVHWWTAFCLSANSTGCSWCANDCVVIVQPTDQRATSLTTTPVRTVNFNRRSWPIMASQAEPSDSVLCSQSRWSSSDRIEDMLEQAAHSEMLFLLPRLSFLITEPKQW